LGLREGLVIDQVGEERFDVAGEALSLWEGLISVVSFQDFEMAALTAEEATNE